jgi:hypothetical protein
MLQDGMQFSTASEAHSYLRAIHQAAFIAVDQDTGETFAFEHRPRRTRHSLRTHPDLRGRRVAFH